MIKAIYNVIRAYLAKEPKMRVKMDIDEMMALVMLVPTGIMVLVIIGQFLQWLVY